MLNTEEIKVQYNLRHNSLDDFIILFAPIVQP